MAETYVVAKQAQLSCPVSAFGGLGDLEVLPEDVRAWPRHTAGPFRVHLLPVEHFFINSARLDRLRLGDVRAPPASS